MISRPFPEIVKSNIPAELICMNREEPDDAWQIAIADNPSSMSADGRSVPDKMFITLYL